MDIPAAERLPVGAALQLVTVGGAACLFRADNHALALVQAGAARACARMLRLPVPDVRQSVRETDPVELRAMLEEAGFLRSCGPFAPHCRDCRPGVRIVTAAGLDVVCRMGPRRVRIVVEDDGLAALLGAALGPLVEDLDTASAGIDAVIAVAGRAGKEATGNGQDDGASAGGCAAETAQGAFDVGRDGVLIAGAVGFADARRIALQGILMALNADAAIAAILHASAVAKGGRALVLAGSTGSGKSTLAAWLAASGWDYLADDFTGLTPGGGRVIRFPVAASLKQPGWPVLRPVLPGLDSCRSFRVGQRDVRYVDLGADGRQASLEVPVEVPVGALVFPHYRADADLHIEPMTPEEAFVGLMTSGSEVVGAERSIGPVAALVNTTPAWRLTYAECASVSDVLRGLL